MKSMCKIWIYLNNIGFKLRWSHIKWFIEKWNFQYFRYQNTFCIPWKVHVFSSNFDLVFECIRKKECSSDAILFMSRTIYICYFCTCMEHGDRGRDSWHLKDKCTEVFRFERDTQPQDEMTPPWYGTDHFLSKFLKWFLLDRTIVMGTGTDVHDWYIKSMLFRVIPETPLIFGIYRQCKYTYLHCKTMKGGWKSVSYLLNSYCSFTTHITQNIWKH